MKTSVQHIIEYIEQNDFNQDTLHFAKLMLEKENQDLIDAKQEGYAEGYQDATNDILSSI